ncbi:zf-C2H2 zinc finger, C2H2 type [Scheffersomyces coipomensis]|uniref:zf-C2H2 zinc finger, C2H2 type n=1 Tax=Scheffersomyces coipomensis TaxID=1788519 RepID=UPI00315CE4D9
MSTTTPTPHSNHLTNIQPSSSNKSNHQQQQQNVRPKSGPITKMILDLILGSILVHFIQLVTSFILHLIVPFPESLSIPSDSAFYSAINKAPSSTSNTSTSTKTNKKKRRDVKVKDLDLFPSIKVQDQQHKEEASSNYQYQCQSQSFVDDDLFSDEEITAPQPCSTGLTTRLLPFKNEKGEIEWAFTEDVIPGNELDAFKLNTNNGPSNAHTENVKKELDEEDDVNLSPTVSNSSSNNESILSNSKKDGNNSGLDSHHSHNTDNSHGGDLTTPLTSHHSSPFTPDRSVDKKILSHSSSSENLVEDDSDEIDDESNVDDGKTHQCPHCDAVFKIRGYLTRHLKKHALTKAYSCPFHSFSIYIDENNVTHKCHPNGGFSRRDTYKTHLKSRHFKYPKGVKTKDRSSSGGTCSMCGEYFRNAEIWCELHVEGGECRYLPAGFKGKSRIKNKLKKRLSKKQQKELDASNLTNQVLHSHYISGNIDPITNTIIDNPTLPDVVSTPFVVDTPHSSSGATPGGPSSANNMPPYDYSGHSPVPSLTSSTSNYQSQMNNSTSNSIPSANTPVSTKSPINYSQILQAQVQNQQYPRNHLPNATNQSQVTPIFEQFDRSNQIQQRKLEEYDDEFCLDIDQLNNSTFNNYNEILHYFKNGAPQQQQQPQAHQQQPTQYMNQKQQPTYNHPSHFQQQQAQAQAQQQYYNQYI